MSKLVEQILNSSEYQESQRNSNDEGGLTEISIDCNKTSAISETNASPRENAQDEFTKISKFFKTMESALRYLNSSAIKSELIKVKNVLFVRLEVEENFEIFNSSKLQDFTNMCSTKSVVVFFMSKSHASFQIFWKSKDIDYLLTLKPPENKTAFEIKELYGFVADCLIHFLSKGHLGIKKDCQYDRDSNEIDLTQLADSEDFNILKLCAEEGERKCVEILLSLNIFKDDPTDILNAQSRAQYLKHFEVLSLLLRANYTYPTYMTEDEFPEDLRLFIKICEDIHEALKSKNTDQVTKIIKENPETHHFYNKSNNSVLKFSLEKKLFSIYEILLAHDVAFGPHEDFSRIFASISESEKTILREIHFRCSKDLPENHMNVLMMNTSIGHDDREKEGKEKLVHRAYSVLNKDPLLNPILKIVAASKHFDIIFDFKRTSVEVVDPTAAPNTRGLFYVDRKICIGAQQLLDPATEHETFGTLAHELCHYAMNLTFKNRAKPYFKSDQPTKAEYKEIIEHCKINRDKEEIIRLVYDYEEHLHSAELIVRVAHLLALYHDQPEKLRQLREIYSTLFNYHSDVAIPAINKALPGIKAKADKEMKEKDTKISILKIIAICMGVISVLGILAAIDVAFVLHEPHYTFSDLSALNQLKVKNGLVYYKYVKVRLHDLFSNDSRAYDTLESDHISLLLEGNALNFSDPHLHYLDKLISHDWEHLTENLKEKIFDSVFIFQNQYLFFSELHNVSQGVFNALTSKQICDILDGEVPEVGKMIESEVEFYIDRKFFTEDMYAIFYYHMNNSMLYEEGTGRYMSKRILEPTQKFLEIVEEFNSLDHLTYSKRIEEIKRDPDFKNLSPSDFRTSKDDLISYSEFHFDMNDIIEMVESSKIFILSSEGGMGKTVAFEQLTKEIKAKFPTRWVSYIDLKNHTILYKDEKLDDIEQFLEEILGFSSKNEFERKIFEELFKSGNVVLLWNGFDEISPTYSDFILNVLQSIQSNTSNVQYVCTRPLYSDSLRFKLSVNPWALVPLDSTDQKVFLFTFFNLRDWGLRIVFDFIKKVENIIEKLKSKHRTVEYVASFDSPLMLNMIAEIVNDDDGTFNTENLYQIYEKFLSKKIEIWQDKSIFAKSFVNNLISKGHKFNLLEFFQKYALKNEFSQDYYHCARLCMGKLDIFQQKIPQNLPRDEISRMGILYTSREDDYRFAHKTFAEFFVAQYLVENIYNAEKVDRREAEMRIEMLHYISENFESGHVAIANFISAFLETQTENDYENFNPVISDVFRTKYKRLFFNLLHQCTANTYDFIFNFFKKDQELLNDLLHISEDETLYTAGKNPYYAHNMPYTSDCPGYWIDYGGQVSLTEDEYEKLINGKNQKGVEVCGYQLRCFLLGYGCFENARDENFFEAIILSKLNENEIIELFTSRTTPLTHAVAEYGSYFNFDIVYDTAKKFLQKQDLQTFFSNFIDIYAKENLTINENPYIALKEIEKSSNDDEIFNLFTERNFLHKAANSGRDVFEILWNFFANHTSLEKQKNILKQSVWEDDWLCNYRYYGSLLYGKKKCRGYPQVTILLTSLISFESDGNYKTFDLVTELYENYFKKTEIQNMILASNDFMPYVIQYCNTDACQEFAQYLKELFKGNEKALIKFLSYPIEKTNKDIFQYLQEYEDIKNQLKIIRDLKDELNNL